MGENTEAVQQVNIFEIAWPSKRNDRINP